MLTDAEAVRVLCFGDSNMHGTCRREPGVQGTPTPDPDYVRLPPAARWPGALQRLLGPGYDVLEEALNGRTTDLDEPGRPGRDGRAYLVPCLQSHRPLDVVVVALGGNDLRPSFGRTPQQVAEVLGTYLADVAEHATDRYGQAPRTVLVGTTGVDGTAPYYADLTGGAIDPVAHAGRSRELSAEIRRVAEATGAAYVDASAVGPGPDGVHLGPAGHAALGDLVAATVRAVAVG